LDAGLIDAVEAAGFPWVAKRPRDSSLDTAKAQKILKNKPLKVNQALKETQTRAETNPVVKGPVLSVRLNGQKLLILAVRNSLLRSLFCW
jgi:hypothetical protein